VAKKTKNDTPQPHPESLCADCFFFADGTCPRALNAMQGVVENISDLVVTGCGGYESVTPAD
jgi:hypothetical protein